MVWSQVVVAKETVEEDPAVGIPDWTDDLVGLSFHFSSYFYYISGQALDPESNKDRVEIGNDGAGGGRAVIPYRGIEIGVNEVAGEVTPARDVKIEVYMLWEGNLSFYHRDAKSG